jgi:hypothetical protein
MMFRPTVTESVFSALSYEIGLSSGLQLTRVPRQGSVQHDTCITEVMEELCEEYYPGANLIDLECEVES